jgi:hypothetical protein
VELASYEMVRLSPFSAASIIWGKVNGPDSDRLNVNKQQKFLVSDIVLNNQVTCSCRQPFKKGGL